MAWTFCRNLFNILYPPFCFHCDLGLDQKDKLFCQACLELLAPMQTQGRCQTCFGPDTPCPRCMERPAFLKRAAAAAHCFSPAATLSCYLCKGNTLFIPAAASLMVMQFCALDWPAPDLIVPLPLSIWTRSKRGGDTHLLLAEQIASMLKICCSQPLKAVWDKSCFLETAHWKTRMVSRKNQEKLLCDKSILLVALEFDDVALRQGAKALLERGASEIYALTLL